MKIWDHKLANFYKEMYTKGQQLFAQQWFKIAMSHFYYIIYFFDVTLCFQIE